jgi:hypothetical protein
MDATAKTSYTATDNNNDGLSVTVNKDGQTNAAALLVPDQSAAELFFKVMAGDPGDIFFEFRTFDDNHDRSDKGLLETFSGTIQKNWPKLVKKSRGGAGCFFVVNKTDGKGLKAENITEARAIFTDLDGAPLANILQETELPPPHIINETSPGKYHAFWKIKGLPLEQFRAMQKMLARRYNGDPSVCDLPRVMRIPGLIHQKIKNSFVVPPSVSRIFKINDAPPYTPDDFLKFVTDNDLKEAVELHAASGMLREDAELEADPDLIAAAMAFVPNNNLHWNDWNRIMMAIWRATRGSKQGSEIAVAWSKKSTKFNYRHTAEKWNELAKSSPNRIGAGTIFMLANNYYPGWREEFEAEQQQLIFEILRDHATCVANKAQPETQQSPPKRDQKPENKKPEDRKADDKKPSNGTAPHTDRSADEIDADQWGTPTDLWGFFEPPELPKGLLPPLIEELAFAEAENIGCDPAGIAMGALTVCASVIPDSVKLQVKVRSKGWMESARLWTTFIGDPSVKKSPIIQRVTWILREIEKELYKKFVEELETYETAKEAAKQVGEQFDEERPIQKRIIIEDTTVEATQIVLQGNHEGILALHDELSGFFGSMDRYNGGSGAADRAFWLRAFNGGPTNIDRVKRGTGHIPNLSVNLLGGIQPDIIRKLASDGVDDGLLQRANSFVLKPSSVGQDKEIDIVTLKYGSKVRALLDMQIPFDPIRFSTKAQEIRDALEAEHVALERSSVINKKLATHIGKYNGMFNRLCLIFHCIENINDELGTIPTLIDEHIARRAGEFLHEFMLPHARAFYFGTLGLSDDDETLKAVANYILVHKISELTTRIIARGSRSMRRLYKRGTDPIFEQLSALGWVKAEKDKKGKVHFLVNPNVHSMFRERAKVEEIRVSNAKAAIAAIMKK